MELSNYINPKRDFVSIANKNGFEVCTICGTDDLIGIKDNTIIRLDYHKINDWYIIIRVGFQLDEKFYGVHGQSDLNEKDFEFMLKSVEDCFKESLEKEWISEIQDKKLKRLISEVLREANE